MRHIRVTARMADAPVIRFQMCTGVSAVLEKVQVRIVMWLAQTTQPLIPDPAPQAPPGKLAEAADTLLAWLKWGGLAGSVGALVIAGIMMSVGRRNRNNMAVEGAMALPWVIGGLALILGSASIVGWLLDGGQ